MSKHIALSISELGQFLHVTAQTLRKQLHAQGYLVEKYKIGNQYRIPVDEVEIFVASNYGVYYEAFIGKYELGTPKDTLRFIIPKGIGVISTERQRSGKVLYYIRNFPLYTDGSGKVVKYRSHGFLSKADAIAKRKRMVEDRDRGVYKYEYLDVQKNQTISKESHVMYYDFCKKYFEDADYEQATKDLYLGITESRIKPYFKDVPVNQLTKQLVQKFVDQYSTNLRKTFIVLSLTLKELHRLDLIEENFYKSLIKPKSTSPTLRKEALTVDETQKFLSYYKGNPIEHCMLILFQCGLRIGELLALQWDEVEFLTESKAKIHINASWGKTDKGMGRKSLKTVSSERVVPINDSYTIDVLKRAKIASKGKKWVAENQSGTRPLDKHNFTRRYCTAVGRKLGIEKHITSHVARHTFISHLVQKGIPYTEIAKLAGHEDISMIVKVYAHAVQNEEEIFKYLNDLYNIS